jgi:hypothetical protein
MIEVQIRRPYQELEENLSVVYGSGLEGVGCTECGEYTYRKDRKIYHEKALVWISLDELKDLLKNKNAND